MHAAVRLTAVGTVSFVLASSGISAVQASDLFDQAVTVQPPPEAAHTAQDPLTRRVAHLEDEHRCSTHGLAEGVVPAHTIVVVDGRASVASFDEGWAIYQGKAPGTIVSVCAG